MMPTKTGDFHVLKKGLTDKLKKLQGEDCPERSEQDGQGRWGHLNIMQTIQKESRRSALKCQKKYSSSIPETKLYQFLIISTKGDVFELTTNLKRDAHFKNSNISET